MSVYNSLKTLDEKTIDKSMNTIIQQTEYLSTTISDFRNFIKNDRHKQKFSIVDMINKSLSIADAALAKYYVQMITDLDTDGYCNGFESEILQAMLNTLNNAKDALDKNIKNEEERFIFLSTDIKGDCIIIKIKDNAGGVPDEIINKLFDPYFTTKGDNEGTGLGLYMCKNIVEDSCGTVSVANRKFIYNGINYVGAEFTISFPIDGKAEFCNR